MDKYRQVENMLRNYTMNKIYIQNTMAEINTIKEADGVGAMTYDKPSTSETYKVSSMVEDIAISNIEKIEELEEDIAARQLEVTKIENTVQGLTEDEQIIIKGFYIDDKRWWEVASEVGLCEGHCKEMRKKAIRKMIKGILG